MSLPIGLVYDAAGAVVLDPDQQIQQSLRLSSTRFERSGLRLPSCGDSCARVSAFRDGSAAASAKAMLSGAVRTLPRDPDPT